MNCMSPCVTYEDVALLYLAVIVRDCYEPALTLILENFTRQKYQQAEAEKAQRAIRKKSGELGDDSQQRPPPRKRSRKRPLPASFGRDGIRDGFRDLPSRISYCCLACPHNADSCRVLTSAAIDSLIRDWIELLVDDLIAGNGGWGGQIEDQDLPDISSEHGRNSTAPSIASGVSRASLTRPSVLSFLTTTTAPTTETNGAADASLSSPSDSSSSVSSSGNSSGRSRGSSNSSANSAEREQLKTKILRALDNLSLTKNIAQLRPHLAAALGDIETLVESVLTLLECLLRFCPAKGMKVAKALSEVRQYHAQLVSLRQSAESKRGTNSTITLNAKELPLLQLQRALSMIECRIIPIIMTHQQDGSLALFPPLLPAVTDIPMLCKFLKNEKCGIDGFLAFPVDMRRLRDSRSSQNQLPATALSLIAAANSKAYLNLSPLDLMAEAREAYDAAQPLALFLNKPIAKRWIVTLHEVLSAFGHGNDSKLLLEEFCSIPDDPQAPVTVQVVPSGYYHGGGRLNSLEDSRTVPSVFVGRDQLVGDLCQLIFHYRERSSLRKNINMAAQTLQSALDLSQAQMPALSTPNIDAGAVARSTIHIASAPNMAVSTVTPGSITSHGAASLWEGGSHAVYDLQSPFSVSSNRRVILLWGAAGIGKTSLGLKVAQKVESAKVFRWHLWLQGPDEKSMMSQLIEFARKNLDSVGSGDSDKGIFESLMTWLKHNDDWFFVADDVTEDSARKLLTEILPSHASTPSSASSPSSSGSGRPSGVLMLTSIHKLTTPGIGVSLEVTPLTTEDSMLLVQKVLSPSQSPPLEAFTSSPLPLSPSRELPEGRLENFGTIEESKECDSLADALHLFHERSEDIRKFVSNVLGNSPILVSIFARLLQLGESMDAILFSYSVESFSSSSSLVGETQTRIGTQAAIEGLSRPERTIELAVKRLQSSSAYSERLKQCALCIFFACGFLHSHRIPVEMLVEVAKALLKEERYKWEGKRKREVSLSPPILPSSSPSLYVSPLALSPPSYGGTSSVSLDPMQLTQHSLRILQEHGLLVVVHGGASVMMHQLIQKQARVMGAKESGDALAARYRERACSVIGVYLYRTLSRLHPTQQDAPPLYEVFKLSSSQHLIENALVYLNLSPTVRINRDIDIADLSFLVGRSLCQKGEFLNAKDILKGAVERYRESFALYDADREEEEEREPEDEELETDGADEPEGLGDGEYSHMDEGNKLKRRGGGDTYRQHPKEEMVRVLMEYVRALVEITESVEVVDKLLVEIWDICQKEMAPEDLERRRLEGTIHFYRAKIYTLHSQAGPGIQNFRLALQLFQSFLPDESVEIAVIHRLLAGCCLRKGDIVPSLGHADEALRLSLLVYPENHPAIAECYVAKGQVLHMRGLYQDAMTQYKAAWKIYEVSVAKDHIMTARLRANMASLYWQMDDLLSAKLAQEEAMEVYERTLGPRSFRTGGLLNNYGCILREYGDIYGSLRAQEEAIAIYSQGTYKDAEIAQALNNIGHTYLELEEYEKASEYLHKALAIRRKKLPARHMQIGKSTLKLGDLYHAIGDNVKAREYLEECLSIRREKHVENNLDIAQVLTSLAQVDIAEIKFSEAKQKLEEALKITTSVFTTKDSANRACILLLLGRVLYCCGDKVEGERLCREAFRMRDVLTREAEAVQHFKPLRLRILDRLARRVVPQVGEMMGLFRPPQLETERQGGL